MNNNELEIGDFIKTNNGYIRQIVEIVNNYEIFDVYRVDNKYNSSSDDYLTEENNYTDIVYPDEIIKSSNKIENLIDVKDILLLKFYDENEIIKFVYDDECLQAIKDLIEDNVYTIIGVFPYKRFLEEI